MTMTVEARVAAALTGKSELVSLLAKGKESIYHNKSKDAGSYPVVVYTVTGDSPHRHSDNKCDAHFAVARVWIETSNGACSRLAELVYDAMTEAGFMWQQDDDGHDDDGNYFYRAMDFTYAELF